MKENFVVRKFLEILTREGDPKSDPFWFLTYSSAKADENTVAGL
jgi:hypothetical protein